MSRRAVLTFLLLAGFVVAGAPARPRAQAQTAEDIVARHLKALGGVDALTQITSRRATGTVTISTQAGEFSGPIELIAKAPNKARASMSLDLSSVGAGQMEIVQRFDGATGELSNSLQGDTEFTGAQLENMRNSIFPTPLLHYKDNGMTLELQPKDTIDGHPVLVVKETPKAGPPVLMYFDPDTYYLVRTVVRINTAQMGDVDQSANPSDYRDVGAVKVPFRVVNQSGGQTLTIVLTKVEHNVPIDDSAFARK